jgi:hypothetical protein
VKSFTADETSNLLGSDERGDTRRDVYAHARNVVAHCLDLADVDAGGIVTPRSAQALSDRRSSANGVAGAFEDREDAVARALHYPAAVLSDSFARRGHRVARDIQFLFNGATPQKKTLIRLLVKELRVMSRQRDPAYLQDPDAGSRTGGSSSPNGI